MFHVKHRGTIGLWIQGKAPDNGAFNLPWGVSRKRLVTALEEICRGGEIRGIINLKVVGSGSVEFYAPVDN